MNDAQEMTVAELDESNQERLGRIMSGALGIPAQIQPGLVENIKIITYLEHLLGPDELEEAKLDFARRISDLLESFESSVRMEVIKRGAGGQPLDLSTMNREQRRSLPSRVEPDGA